MSGSTNSKISSQNDQVRKQYKYDKKYWRYQNNENAQRYEDKKEATRLSQQFLDDQRVYADVRNFQDYRLAKQVQDQQYDVTREAYSRRWNIREQQLGINELRAACARENEWRQ